MTRYFVTTRHIDAPAQSLWEVLFDVARWPEWTPTIDSVELLDDGPLQVGSRARIRQPRLPRATWQVTEVVEGRSFTWEATGSPDRAPLPVALEYGEERRGPAPVEAAAYFLAAEALTNIVRYAGATRAE